MSIEHDLVDAAEQLRSTASLARAGLSRRAVATAVAAGELIRLRPGWYVESRRWDAVHPEARHLIAVAAAEHTAGSAERVYSHRTSASLHGLPAWSAWMRGPGAAEELDACGVHALFRPGTSGTANTHLIRHHGRLEEADIVTVAGLRVTGVERTLYDLAVSEPFAVALACADQQLRSIAIDRRAVDFESWALWRERLLARGRREAGARGARGGRGARAVRAIAVLADPRSESALESVSRLRALQAGLDVELQVSVRAEAGGLLYLDFVFRGLGFFGECDGVAKYSHPEQLAGAGADLIVERERRRHNWVSGSTGMRGVRWGAADVVTLDRFIKRMRAFGVPTPGRATRAYGAEIADFLDRLS